MINIFGSFPQSRPRRLRKNKWIRDLFNEVNISNKDFIKPFFVIEGVNKKEKIKSLPDNYRFSIDLLIEEIKKLRDIGVKAVMLFPVIDQDLKDLTGREAVNENNLLCRAIIAIKEQILDIGILSDIALDPYMIHGHDGILNKDSDYVLNDQTNEILSKQALILAQSGVDMVCPSDMMDGRVGYIRKILDDNGFIDVGIISYAIKYASNLYGPFRDAVNSAQNIKNSDKKNYQMDYRNSSDIFKEVATDIEEGADAIIIKPATFYLDIISQIKENFKIPIITYHVSGEYSMLCAAAKDGLIDFDKVFEENMIACKRAGANAIIHYGNLSKNN
ncbi:porphobilinogen synthase [Rickettsiales bacterium]|nr:porphobilinogen synthase [Rickettsiales bacterium]